MDEQTLNEFRGYKISLNYSCENQEDYCHVKNFIKCEDINGTCIEYEGRPSGNYDLSVDCGDNEKMVCFLGQSECHKHGGICVENRYGTPPEGYTITDYDCEQGTRVDCYISGKLNIFQKFIQWLRGLF